MQVVGGQNHSLALKGDGTVLAWGDNGSGQLGDGTQTRRTNPVPVSDLTDVIYVTAGWYHSVAVKADGTVWTWGANSGGTRGDGTTGGIDMVPVQVAGIAGAVAVAAGNSFTIALLSSGAIKSWGASAGDGQLGDGGTTARLTPVDVSGISTAVNIASGEAHSLAALADGTVWAWGRNTNGQVGDGSGTSNQYLPVRSLNVTGATQVAAFSNFSLAVDGNAVWGWGYNRDFQLGRTTPAANEPTPGVIPDFTGAVEVAAGGSHGLARRTDGTVWAWGTNFYGYLAVNDTTARSTPAQSSKDDGGIILVGNAASIGAGNYHSLYTGSDASGWASGYNGYGQLGIGSTISKTVFTKLVSAPVLVDFDTFLVCAPPPTDGQLPDPDGFGPGPLPIEAFVPGEIVFTPPDDFFDPDSPDGINDKYEPPNLIAPEVPGFEDFPIGEFPIEGIEFDEPSFDDCFGVGDDFDFGGCEPGGGGGGGGKKKGGGKAPPGTGKTGPGSPTKPGQVKLKLGKKIKKGKTFAKKRCFDNALIINIIKKLAAELGVDPTTKLTYDPNCKKRYTGCFPAGSTKWDAIWKLSQMCGFEPIPGDDGTIDIAPIEPLDVVWEFHEDTNLIVLSREMDTLELHSYVEVFQYPIIRGGRVLRNGFSVIEPVRSIFTIDPEKILRIEVDGDVDEDAARNMAKVEAAKQAGNAFQVTAVVPYDPRYKVRHQAWIRRPTFGLNHRFMIYSIEPDLSDQGHLAVLQARFLGPIIQV